MCQSTGIWPDYGEAGVLGLEATGQKFNTPPTAGDLAMSIWMAHPPLPAPGVTGEVASEAQDRESSRTGNPHRRRRRPCA